MHHNCVMVSHDKKVDKKRKWMVPRDQWEAIVQTRSDNFHGEQPAITGDTGMSAATGEGKGSWQHEWQQ